MPASSRLSPQQRADVESAVDAAERLSGLRFAVRIGRLEAGRETAQALHGGCADPARTVLVAVDPSARLIEIVTGAAAAARISDRTCGLAALAMASSFQAGDLVRGLRDGLRLLADHAASP